MTLLRTHPLRRAALVGAAPVAVLYLLTLAPTITINDACDLITASWTHGVAHPPGYPVYVALGSVFAHLLPIGDVAFRYNLFSLVAAVASVAALAVLATLVADSWMAGVAAAWLYGVSRGFWSEAIVTEVYALNVLIVTGTLLCLVLWHERRDARYLVCAAFGVGTGLAHHLSLVVAVPGMFAFVLLLRHTAPWRWSWLALLAAVALIGPALYLTVLLAARLHPVYSFGDPSTFPRLVSHVRADLYHFLLVPIGSREWAERLLTLIPAIAWPLGWIGALAGAAGGLLLLRTRPATGTLCALVMAGYVTLAAAYRIPDIAAYFLPMQMVACLGVAALLGATMRLLARRAGAIAAVVVLVVSAGYTTSLAVRTYPQLDTRGSHLTRAILESLARIATDDGRRPATLFTDGDTQIFGLCYLLYVENRWPMLRVVDPTDLVGPMVYHLRRGSAGGVLHYNAATVLRVQEAILDTLQDAAFFGAAPSNIPRGWRLQQEGLLFRAVRVGQTITPAHDPWQYVPLAELDRAHGRTRTEDRWALALMAILHGAALRDAGNAPAARASWELAERIAGDEPEVNQTLARYYLSIGDTARALARSGRAVADAPMHGSARALDADLRLAAGDTSSALSELEYLHTHNGRLSSLQEIRLGNLYASRGEWTKAIGVYEHALALDPSAGDGWISLGSAYGSAGRAADAVTALEKGFSLGAGSPAARVQMGIALVQQGRIAEADQELRRAVREAPTLAEAHGGLGALLLQQGRLEDAETEWREALRLDPHYPHAHLALGSIARVRGNLTLAERELNLADAEHPGDPQTLLQIGYVFYAQGRSADARTAWEAAREAAPNDPTIAQALQLLDHAPATP